MISFAINLKHCHQRWQNCGTLLLPREKMFAPCLRIVKLVDELSEHRISSDAKSAFLTRKDHFYGRIGHAIAFS